MDKYPQSTQLMTAYCSFCDTVLNDPSEANELRKKVAALQEDEGAGSSAGGRLEDAEVQGALEASTEKSGATGNGSDNDDHRVKIQKYFS
eukprot:3391538-Rhodomonas_salina.1